VRVEPPGLLLLELLVLLLSRSVLRLRLEWMRRESSPLLLLVKVEVAGKGGYCCCWGRSGREGKKFRRKERERERERERKVVQPPREVVECLVVI